MDAAVAHTFRLVALRDYAAMSIRDAKTSEDPGSAWRRLVRRIGGFLNSKRHGGHMAPN